jgi:hypothetical protein
MVLSTWFAIIAEASNLGGMSMKIRSQLAWLVSLMLSIIAGPPTQAQTNPHKIPVVYLGECPQFGLNAANWIVVHGHHAISLVTGGTDWDGFVMAVATDSLLHGHFPKIGAPPLPPGTLTFRVLSSTESKPEFEIGALSSDAGCYIVTGDFEPVNGVVTFTVPSGSMVVQMYTANGTEARTVIGDIKFNGQPIHGLTRKEESSATDQNFCSFAPVCP